jgi:hypothetical protein
VEVEEYGGALGVVMVVVVGVASNGIASMLANAEAYVLVYNYEYSMKTQNTHSHTHVSSSEKERVPIQ